PGLPSDGHARDARLEHEAVAHEPLAVTGESARAELNFLDHEDERVPGDHLGAEAGAFHAGKAQEAAVIHADLEEVAAQLRRRFDHQHAGVERAPGDVAGYPELIVPDLLGPHGPGEI